MELAERLPFCPRCAYPLIGLPEAHQCPECGLPYDAASRMWTAVPGRWGLRRTINLCLGVLAIFLGTFHVVAGLIMMLRSGMNRSLGIVSGPFLLVAAWYFLRAWRMDREPKSRFLAIVPDGIWYVDGTMSHRHLAWARVRSVESQSRDVEIALILHLTSIGKVAIPRDLISHADAQVAISLIRARIAGSTG